MSHFPFFKTMDIFVSHPSPSRFVLARYSSDICSCLEQFFIPPSITVILFINESDNIRLPVFKSCSFNAENKVSILSPVLTKFNVNIFTFSFKDAIL